MKKSLKLLLAIGALTAAASPSFADVVLPGNGTIGNGELVLYVRNLTQGTTYARGLEVQIDDILTEAQVAAIPYTADTPNTQISVPVTSFSLGTIGPDANLTAFLGAALDTDDVDWSIVGGSGGNVSTLGSVRYVTTTEATVLSSPSGTAGTSPTNALLRTGYSGLYSQLGALNEFLPDESGSSVIGANYSSNAHNWYGAGPNSLVDIGTAGNFYLFATNGGSNPNRSRVFELFDVTLSADGTLSMQAVSAVPLPAAVWLLGSGLLGLAGIGRRKKIAA